MTRVINDTIHKSNKWRKDLKFNSKIKISFWEKFIRPSVFHLKGERCEVCGSAENIDVHHTSYTVQTIETLKVFCRHCHKQWHKQHGDALSMERSDIQPYVHNTEEKQ